MSYAHAFDSAQRLLNRVSRDGRPSSDPTFQPSLLPVGLANEIHTWNGFSATPILGATNATASTFENQSLVLQRNVEFDTTLEDGFSGGADVAARYAYTRDAGGRVTAIARRYATGALTIPGMPSPVFPPGSTYTYRPDGRIGTMTGPDGTHDFTYDARGLMATRTVAGEGTYAYAYDAVGRNTRITFPDGHERVQAFDDLGRITSRCYDYSAVPGAATRCYTAIYDPVGNPVRMTDPEGADVMTYDALDRLTSVTREVGGVPISTETYAFNAMGALSVNAGALMDHQRPRLDGGGLADSAVPASLGGLPINLDAAGRITSLRGVALGYSGRGYLIEANPPVPEVATRILVDADMRRVLKVTADGAQVDWYVYEGMDRVARLDRFGGVVESTLFEGIDHPLRVNRGGTRVFYELDLAGNVRRLRGVGGGTDLGGYRYSAFGAQLEDTASGSFDQDLRWKGRPRDALGGGLETYDMRAREWVPAMAASASVDELAFHGPASSLWAWPGHSPPRWSDPTGRLAPPPAGVAVGVGVGAGAVLGPVGVGLGVGAALIYYSLHAPANSGGSSSGSGPGGSGGGTGASPDPGAAPVPGDSGGGPGGGGPYRTPPRPPDSGPRYPQCAGLRFDATTLCCRRATGYGGDFSEECPPPERENYDHCMSENGF